MGGSAQYVDERWKWRAAMLYVVLLRSRDSDSEKSQQWLWKIVARRNYLNDSLYSVPGQLLYVDKDQNVYGLMGSSK